ncbi:MAG TPA: hypothetical protein VGO85_03440 [Caldimonas sp.]|jgi:hypothetical protein|nr:hypothetical protein [Caldimonas sp.]
MIKAWARALAILILMLTVVVTVLMAMAWTMLPLDGVAVTLHGQTFSLDDLQGARKVLFFLMAVVVVVIALLAALAAIVVGLGFGALGMVIGLIATVGSVALVMAPFALVGWLLWRLFRSRPTATVVARP